MPNELAKTNPGAVVPTDVSASALEMGLGYGDFSKFTSSDRLKFIAALCQSTGLNVLSRPFEIINIGGKIVLYATKGCAEQLRKIHKVNIQVVSTSQELGCFVVRVKATDGNGRFDENLGAVAIGENVSGEARAIAMMKAHTKALRRVTLSICGLGMIDESEVEDMKNVTPATEVSTASDVSLLNEPENPEVDKLLADIKAETLKAVPGQGITDKRKKSDLWQNCFGKSSWKEVEILSVEILSAGLDRMRAFSTVEAEKEKPAVIDVTPTASASDDGDFGPATSSAQSEPAQKPDPKPEGSITVETQDKLEILISEAGLDAVKFIKFLRRQGLPGGAHLKEGQALDYMIEMRAVKLMKRWDEYVREFHSWVAGGMKPDAPKEAK